MIIQTGYFNFTIIHTLPSTLVLMSVSTNVPMVTFYCPTHWYLHQYNNGGAPHARHDPVHCLGVPLVVDGDIGRIHQVEGDDRYYGRHHIERPQDRERSTYSTYTLQLCYYCYAAMCTVVYTMYLMYYIILCMLYYMYMCIIVCIIVHVGIMYL